MKRFSFEMSVFYQDDNPVFVFGMNGSGKEILTELLHKYLLINFETEFICLLPVYKKISMLNHLNQYQKVERFCSHLSKLNCANEWRKKYGFEIDKDRILSEITTLNLTNATNILYKNLNEYRQLKKWGYSSSKLLFYLKQLHELFPNAKYIHIVRDGRNIALLEQKRRSLPKNIKESASFWTFYLKQAFDFFSRKPENRVFLIKYESLIKNPDVILFLLINFLGINDYGRQLIRFISNNIQKEINRDQVDWKVGLSESEKSIYHNIAGEMLKNHGYEIPQRTNQLSKNKKIKSQKKKSCDKISE